MTRLERCNDLARQTATLGLVVGLYFGAGGATAWAADPESDARVIALEQDAKQLEQNIASEAVRNQAEADAEKYDAGFSDPNDPIEQRLRDLRDAIEARVRQYESTGS